MSHNIIVNEESSMSPNNPTSPAFVADPNYDPKHPEFDEIEKVALFAAPLEFWNSPRCCGKTTRWTARAIETYLAIGVPSRLDRRKRTEAQAYGPGLVTDYLRERFGVTAEKSKTERGALDVIVDGENFGPFLFFGSGDRADCDRALPRKYAHILLDEAAAKPGFGYETREPSAFLDSCFSARKISPDLTVTIAGNETLRWCPYLAEVEAVAAVRPKAARVVQFHHQFLDTTGDDDDVLTALSLTTIGAYATRSEGLDATGLISPIDGDFAVDFAGDGVAIGHTPTMYFIISKPDAPAWTMAQHDRAQVFVSQLFANGKLKFPTKKDALDASRVFSRILLF